MTHGMLAVIGLGGGELILLLCLGLIFFGCFVLVPLAVVLFFVVRSANKKPATTGPTKSDLAPILPVDRPVAQPANMAGAQFHRANLSGADFNDVNLTNARFHNVNLSNTVVTAAQMGGAAFKHIGPPPDPEGKQERQRPVRFEEMMLCDSLFRKVDLSNVRITECDLTGMTINGLLVTDLLLAYQKLPTTPTEGAS